MKKSVIVTVLFIAFAGSTFWMMYRAGPGQQIGEDDKVEMVAYFDNVALLEPKAKVAVAGYVVGQVETLKPDTDTVDGVKVPRVRVTFKINKSIYDELGKDTLAKVGQESFLGAKYLELVARSTGGEFGKDTSGLPRVTSEKYSDLFTTAGSLTDQIQPLIASAKSLIDNLNDNVLSPANVNQISELLKHTDELVLTAEDFISQTQSRMMDRDGLMDDVEGLIETLEQTLVQARGNLATLTDKAVGTMQNADSLMLTADNSLKTITDDVSTKVVPTAVDLMEDADKLIVGLEPRLDSTFTKVDKALVSADDLLNAKELYATLYEARRLMQEMQLLVISLRADPSQIVFGGPGAEEEAEKPDDGMSRRTGGRGAPYDN